MDTGTQVISAGTLPFPAWPGLVPPDPGPAAAAPEIRSLNWGNLCTVVIPCLNEAATIHPLVTAVRQHLTAVLVVDDGSSDDTASLARRAGAEVLSHSRPCGKGAALHTGWQAARERGFHWALVLDGDGQHSPDDIPAFLACAEVTAANLVVGNRMTDPRGMPWVRRLVNRWMSGRISRATGCLLPDTQCGFRLINLDAWAALAISSAHFEIESEVLLAFATAGDRIEFVPIRVIYENERSKIRPLRDTWRWFRWWREAKKIHNGVR